MTGKWKESVGCRWIVLLLVDAAAREEDREMQSVAMKGLIDVLSSMEYCPVFDCSQLIDVKRIKTAPPLEEEGEIGWCFWKQGDAVKDIVDICECLLPVKRMKVSEEREWLLLVMREQGVLEKILFMLWGIEYKREFNFTIEREVVSDERKGDEWILKSQQFQMEYRSLQQLLLHTPSLFTSISPSFFMTHSQEEMLSIVEQAKASSRSENGIYKNSLGL